jgi:hypothetical protein
LSSLFLSFFVCADTWYLLRCLRYCDLMYGPASVAVSFRQNLSNLKFIARRLNYRDAFVGIFLRGGASVVHKIHLTSSCGFSLSRCILPLFQCHLYRWSWFCKECFAHWQPRLLATHWRTFVKMCACYDGRFLHGDASNQQLNLNPMMVDVWLLLGKHYRKSTVMSCKRNGRRAWR